MNRFGTVLAILLAAPCLSGCPGAGPEAPHPPAGETPASPALGPEGELVGSVKLAPKELPEQNPYIERSCRIGYEVIDAPEEVEAPGKGRWRWGWLRLFQAKFIACYAPEELTHLFVDLDGDGAVIDEDPIPLVELRGTDTRAFRLEKFPCKVRQGEEEFTFDLTFNLYPVEGPMESNHPEMKGLVAVHMISLGTVLAGQFMYQGTAVEVLWVPGFRPHFQAPSYAQRDCIGVQYSSSVFLGGRKLVVDRPVTLEDGVPVVSVRAAPVDRLVSMNAPEDMVCLLAHIEDKYCLAIPHEGKVQLPPGRHLVFPAYTRVHEGVEVEGLSVIPGFHVKESATLGGPFRLKTELAARVSSRSVSFGVRLLDAHDRNAMVFRNGLEIPAPSLRIEGPDGKILHEESFKPG